MFQKEGVSSDPIRRFIPERCVETEQNQLAQFGRKRPGLHSLKCALNKGEEHEAEEIETPHQTDSNQAHPRKSPQLEEACRDRT